MKSVHIRCFPIILIVVLMIVALAYPNVQSFAQSRQSSPTPAQVPVGQSGKMGLEAAELLRQLDADHDGYILQSEWNRFFAERDQDGDGRLSPEEIQASFNRAATEESLGADYGRLAAFERLDKNKNDAIDAAEWPGKKKDFQYLDSNRNGSLSREEFLAKNGRWWNEPFENLDFNNDKVISRSEWLDSDSSFKRLDRDRNGAIERSEFYRPR